MSITQTTTQTPAPSNSELEALLKELAAQRAALNRGNVITTVVGLLLLGLLSFYFYYGYRRITPVIEPDMVVDVVDGYVDQYAPEVRASLVTEVKRSAPKWAEDLSKQLVKSIPGGRKQLEDVVLEQVTLNLNEADLLAEKQFRTFLHDNKTKLQADLKELARSDKLADASLKDLTEAMDQALQTDLRAQAKQTLNGLASLITRMKYLKANKDLTREQQLERRLVQLTRRLQMEKVDPAIFTLLPREQPVVRGAKDTPTTGTPVKKRDATKPATKGPGK